MQNWIYGQNTNYSGDEVIVQTANSNSHSYSHNVEGRRNAKCKVTILTTYGTCINFLSKLLC